MKILLLPFSMLYGIVTDVRNYLYNKGFWKEFTFDKPIINVGNITVGGTGKTPHVEYLIRLLKDKYAITTLSRGYGRKTKGFILANSSVNAQVIGDEPYQFYQKFNQEIDVAVGENRVEAITKIFAQSPDKDLIILDDAFQHRAIKPSLNILLIDYSRPINSDFPFPAGRLRERRHGAKRANVIIITKCPDDLSMEKQKQIELLVESYSQPNVPFFFTTILYGKIQNCRSLEPHILPKKVVLLSGIANPTAFEKYAKQHFNVVNHLIFNDHHDFTEKDFESISSQNRNDGTVILMTEKDMVKFKPFLNHELLRDLKLCYLPIEIDFLTDEMKLDFNSLIFNEVKRVKYVEE